MRLRELRDSRAVEPLFRAVQEPANRNNRGLLVSALQALDCREHFTDLFQLVLHGNYEVQCKALSILERQDFVVNEAELVGAERALADFLADPPIDRAELLGAELEAILDRLRRHRAGGPGS